MPVARYFLPWDRPLLPQAVDYLAREWDGKGPLDLTALLVVVPTRQSGRRLREALAAHAAARGSAVLPPRVMLPEALLVAGPSIPDVASRLESQLAWIEVFRGIALDEFRAVFPVDPPAQNFSWARRLAQDFGRLQSTLAEAGLHLSDVAAKAGDDFPERERWEELARLAQRQAERLEARGLREVQAVKMERALAPALPAGIQRLVIIGTPDPLPLAIEVLERHAATVPVEVVIFAPETESSAFDRWGRPAVPAWETRELALPDFEPHVQLCVDPEDQAERVAAAVARYDDPDGWIAIGAGDPEVLPLLENELAHAGRATFNPEGAPRRDDELFHLLAALAEFAREDSFAALASLARCPDFRAFLRSRAGSNFSSAGFLANLDELHARHLPPDLREARRHEPQNVELKACAEIRETLTQGRFPANAAAALATIFGARKFNLSVPGDAQAAEAAETWTGVMREIGTASAEFPDISNAEWWELALGLYGEAVRYEDKPPGAIELQGWLELLWEDAPHLMVTGLNDGRVPDSVVGDPFLPESLRGRLGVKTNGARFARDAYLLTALEKCRRKGGRLDLLLGKTSAVGDPLRPSRLLFRCADAELPARVAYLFQSTDASHPNPPWRRAWRLTPRVERAPRRMAATALRAWLECPFRFYLSRVLRLEAVDPMKSELDAMDFGSLCHAALEAMGREPALRDCTDAGSLREFLLAALERHAVELLGRELTLPLLVQLESARQRLSRAADVQAQLRTEGWVIVEVERAFSLPVGAMTITGKIDRIDRHETTGAIRVIDYKTSDTPSRPDEAHRRPIPRGMQPPAFAIFPDGTERHAWSDLQLPLYLRALAAEQAGPVECGYFNLPKAATETGFARWDDFTADLAAAAWRCAEGVVAAIEAGEFWPPNETIREDYDPFASLFHHGAAESVEWKGKNA